ncbi:hypothetical protein LIER_38485 [Lithospermum erythrorhizon]|uniref:WAT1-related protein n=1 Tax=Lithospermum erythrorhizon TaxID=34254 RepID=A0AAV3Q0L0_LITER
MGKLWNVVHGLRPILMMILIQIMSAGMVIMYKLASEYDMSMKVLTAYRYTIASATLIPLAFFLERKNRPKLTWMVVLQAFSSAFFAGTMAQNMYAESLVLTSATFATAMFNLVPAVTFIMAILFRSLQH